MKTSFQQCILGADHAGVTLKLQCAQMLIAEGMPIEDVGSFDTTSVDYPDIAQQAVDLMAQSAGSAGILCCGSGIGMSMAANRSRSIRAALCHNAEFARLARAHNDANVLVLPARFLTAEEGLVIVRTFLTTSFEGGRHAKRIEKLHQLGG